MNTLDTIADTSRAVAGALERERVTFGHFSMMLAARACPGLPFARLVDEAGVTKETVRGHILRSNTLWNATSMAPAAPISLTPAGEKKLERINSLISGASLSD